MSSCSSFADCYLSLLFFNGCFGASAAYSGEWHDGKYNGEGTLTLPSGERYEGEEGGRRQAGCVSKKMAVRFIIPIALG